jgi:hypothetical protein
MAEVVGSINLHMILNSCLQGYLAMASGRARQEDTERIDLFLFLRTAVYNQAMYIVR